MQRVRLPLRLAALAALALVASCAEPTTIPEPGPTALAPTLHRGQAQQNLVPGQIIVRFRGGADANEVAVANGAGLKKSLRLGRTFLLAVEPGEEEAMAAKLARHPHVEFAEPDYVIQLTPCEVGQCEETNDGFRAYKWDLHNTGSFFNCCVAPAGTIFTGAADADIDWQEMYDFLETTGGGVTGSAVIGILDTGIRSTHQDIAGKVIGAQRFVDLLPTGCVDAACTNRNDGSDNHGHGTHVAGISAALANNGTGVMGVGYHPNIRLLAVKVCTGTGSCPSSAVADGITWAADNGANILNLSLGGGSMATAGSAAQQAALQYALSRNVLAFCATGNDDGVAGYAPGGQLGVSFPARFPECVAVAATNWSDAKASYSNYGFGTEISAPGGASPSPFALVLSLAHSSNTGYNWRSGTSMATPQAAGLAAMLYARGMTDVQQIRTRLQTTADDKGAVGYDDRFGHGRINAYRAVTGLDPNAPPVADAGGPYDGDEGSAIAFDGSASADPNGKPLTYFWQFGDGNTSSAASPSHTYADNGTYGAALKVTDQSGLMDQTNRSVTVRNVAPSVSASLSAMSAPSGATIGLQGSFSDPGLLDNPWTWQIDWGMGAPGTGSTASQSAAITGSRQFCAAGSYPVTLSVTDKDGGTGSATRTLTVSRVVVSLMAPAAVNTGGSGTIPVHVLSTATFDATTVSPAAATLGNGVGDEAGVARRSNGSYMATVGDVDGDGRPDLTLHFERSALVANGDLHAGTITLVLLAGLTDGCVQVQGTASVKAVP